MDKLSIAFLTIIFLNGGSLLIWVGLMLALFTQMLPLNYKTLFNVTTFTTYCFYGFTGIIYTFLCALSLLMCGAMYWFELSIDDVKNKMKELNVNENLSTDDDHTVQIEQYIDTFSQYKIKYVNMFCEKTGLKINSTWITSVGTLYTHVSVVFDKFCQIFYGLMCRFRTLTRNMKGLKTLYNAYDTMYQYKISIDNLKTLNVESRNKSDALSLQIQKDTLSPKTTDPLKLMDLCNFPELNIDQDSFNQDMMDAQAKFDKMSPDERKKEAEAMMNMMKNMFDSFDNMKTMMDGLAQ